MSGWLEVKVVLIVLPQAKRHCWRKADVETGMEISLIGAAFLEGVAVVCAVYSSDLLPLLASIKRLGE